MRTFWIVPLVALVVFIIIYAIRSRHSSSNVYRSRFFSRMPRERQPKSNRQDSNPQDSIYMTPVIFGAGMDGAHAPASSPHCATGVADAGGSCSTGGDGGGASS